MSHAEFVSAPPPVAPHDTFCVYFAKQLIARMGYARCELPEAAELAAHADIVLSLDDGFSLTIACLVDREAHPGKVFGLSSYAVESIGEACLKYTSKVFSRKMPVAIHIYEIGPADADGSQRQRLAPHKPVGFTAKVRPSAWIVDTASRSVWTNARFAARWPKRIIERLLSSPRESDEALAVPAVAATVKPSFPWLTSAIIAALIAIFAAEVQFGVQPWTKLLQPSLLTLAAFGGLTKGLVLESGEWYRLLSAPLLHGDLAHLAMNCIALFMAGRILEGLIGRAWFVVILVVSALCGALGSLLYNPPTLISVGASGGVTGLFAAMLVLSLHFRHGASRTALQVAAVYVLIPSLLPLTSSGGIQTIDYAAHFGGALGGGATALVLLAIWPRDAIRPRFGAFAIAAAIAGLAAFAYPAIPLAEAYPSIRLQAGLIPAAKLPRTDADAKSQSATLVEAYPRDPRAHLMRAHALFDARDSAGAERELRAALAEEALWRRWFTVDLSSQIRAALAAVLVDRRQIEEAKAVVQPICGTAPEPSKSFLDRMKLCGN